MNNKPDIPERIGRAINELDIDFSSFTITGWIVSTLSLGVGGGIAWLASSAMIKRNGLDLGAGLVFCFTMIAVTTATFLALRWISHRVGLPVIKPNSTKASREND